MVICLFRKGVTNVSTMLWVIVKSRFKFEFFTLFWNCFTAFWASKISRWRGQVLGKCTCNKNKWAFGIFKQWPKQILIKVPNVEVSGLFRDRDFQFVMSLDTSLIVFLNHWLSKLFKWYRNLPPNVILQEQCMLLLPASVDFLQRKSQVL